MRSEKKIFPSLWTPKYDFPLNLILGVSISMVSDFCSISSKVFSRRSSLLSSYLAYLSSSKILALLET
jgi:hypothetical protein